MVKEKLKNREIKNLENLYLEFVEFYDMILDTLELEYNLETGNLIDIKI